MNLVIDSNVLFSALIKESITRKLILKHEGFFLFPEFVFEEMEKHKEELREKAKITDEDFRKLLQLILKKILVVPNEVLIFYKKEAISIIKDIDIDDVAFIACALAYPESFIWSDDKKLKKQNRIKVFNTQEIIKLFNFM